LPNLGVSGRDAAQGGEKDRPTRHSTNTIAGHFPSLFSHPYRMIMRPLLILAQMTDGDPFFPTAI
jgi:hypothetical protein